ncbi:MAG TPA: hypothetical protein VGN80_08725 [Devosiaceae bacterium]|nr:hypothetical protein [Devosiaceae bacterium]
MKRLLIVFMALFATEAAAQFNLGAATSRPVPRATQLATHEAMIHLRLEAACRDYFSPEQRAKLRNAAGTAFIAAGYEQRGAIAALGELDEIMAGQSRWTAERCQTGFASFREGRRAPGSGLLR